MDQHSAWADLIQRLEMELEEKVLKYRLTLKDWPQLEWNWPKESSRGGTECTILAYIDSGSCALSIQNKRHLHWKVLDSSQGMSNEMEFSTQAHNLLMKTEAAISEHQESKNCSASDALPSPGVNPLEGSPKCSCGKLGLGRRSRLPTLERSRGSSWEPRD